MREGGSYRIDKKGGKPKLVERTKPAEPSAPAPAKPEPKTEGDK